MIFIIGSFLSLIPNDCAIDVKNHNFRKFELELYDVEILIRYRRYPAVLNFSTTI